MHALPAAVAETALLYAATHVGKIRSVNEDRCGTPEWRTNGENENWRGAVDRSSGWALVADGMGGHGAGEIASEIAVDSLARHLSTGFSEENLTEAIQDANRSIYDAMSTSFGRPAMGTTVVGMILNRTTCTFFNIGDSRAYVLRGRELRKHSLDHTPMVGRFPGSRSHALTQSLGGTVDRRKLDPHIEQVAIVPGDVIVLCSDGLTDLVEEDAIAGILRSGPTHPAMALIDAALAAGGRDNITVVVVNI